MSGTLYICPTPIGNLEDITLRTLRVLKEVDIIGAEDTRNSIKLLNHYEIKNKLTSYHKFNYLTKGKYLIERLLEGEDIAIISDAGMPGISDPGSELIAMAIEENINIEVLPGASASITALVLSGLNTERFFFYGFLSSKKSEKKRELEKLKDYGETIIFYESPHRIFETLELLEEELGNRNVAICKEITKLHENVIRGDLKSAIAELTETVNKGEYVIVLEGAGEVEEEEIDIKAKLILAMEGGLSKKEAVKLVSQQYKLPKNRVYSESLEL